MTKRGTFITVEGVDGAGKSTQFEVIVDAPERAVFWWALQYSWDGRVVIREPDSLKRKLYDAGRRMATAYAPE